MNQAEFDIEEHCRQCRKADHSHLDRNPICETSGFIEQVKCKNTKETVYRACAKLPKYQTQENAQPFINEYII